MDEYEGLDFAINVALVEALDLLDVAFEQYEALEDLPYSRIEISGYGADMLDDLSVALHRNHQSQVGYGFDQPGLRTASQLVQTAADALREYAAGSHDAAAYLAELSHDLLVLVGSAATVQRLVSLAGDARGLSGEGSSNDATSKRRASAR